MGIISIVLSKKKKKLDWNLEVCTGAREYVFASIMPNDLKQLVGLLYK